VLAGGVGGAGDAFGEVDGGCWAPAEANTAQIKPTTKTICVPIFCRLYIWKCMIGFN
jgi:hypothetical protein